MSSSDDKIKLVVIGDLASHRKGVDVALEALRLVRDDRLRLLVVGGGRLQARLEHQAREDPRVRFLGPLRPREVSAVLADSDVLLFPTRSDIFGLTLVEAMGCEATPVVSRAAGAVDDLAVDGVNAIVIDNRDPPTWATAISKLADADLRSVLGGRARRTIVARWTIEHATGAMLAGLRLSASGGPGKA
jgi:D-inositol-3-phosphate glycosyltransferase